jgi:hypothetical protein
VTVSARLTQRASLTQRAELQASSMGISDGRMQGQQWHSNKVDLANLRTCVPRSQAGQEVLAGAHHSQPTSSPLWGLVSKLSTPSRPRKNS